MPKVSVVIPTYNYAHFLREAIESVLAQTFRDFEVIVVDDGSTDNTPEVVAQFGDRVQYIRQANQGPNAARNTGVLAARGEFIALLDADDLWLPDKLSRQVALADTRPEAGLIYSGMLLFDSESGAVIGYHPLARCREGWVLRDLYMYHFVPSPTPLIRREVFEQVGIFDETAIGPDDWDLLMRIAAHYQFAFVPDFLAMYRVHASVAGSKSIETYAAEMLDFFERMADQYPVELADLRQRRLALFMQRIGWRYIIHGEQEAGRRWLINAIKTWPWCWRAYWLLLPTVFGPQMSPYQTQQSRIAYLRAKQCLSRGDLSEARRLLVESIRINPWNNRNAYLGFLVSLGGVHLVRRVMRKRVVDDARMQAEISDNLAVGQQW